MTILSDSRQIVVLGAGGHAGVVIAELIQQNYPILGLTDIKLNKGDKKYGLSVLGSDDVILGFSRSEVELVNGVGSLPNSNSRSDLYGRYEELGYQFRSVVSCDASVSTHVAIGVGVQIMAGAVIQAGVEIENGVVINTGSLIDHDCSIGSEVWVSPGVTMCGNVRIEPGAYIGAGSVLLQGITIGSRSLIGAGSVIRESIPPEKKIIQRRTYVE